MFPKIVVAIPFLTGLAFVISASGWQAEQTPPAVKQKGLMVPTEKPQLPPPPPDGSEFRVQSEVDLVLLDVSVKDSQGGFVSGLQKDNFRIFEDKQEQPVSVFGAQDAPVTVGLVVDNSGSIRPVKPEIVTAALTFVTQSNPQDETFIVNFNDQVQMGLPDDIPFSSDPQVLRQALLSNPAQGRTAFYDGLKRALEHIEKGRLDKKTLVVIGDGGDNMSETTKDELTAMAERSPVTIYTIGVYNSRDKGKDPGFLKKLAHITGGEYYHPENTSELVGVSEKVAHDIRNRYTVGFAPDVSTFDGSKRKLRIHVTGEDGRKLEARTRTHYIAEPAASRSRSAEQ
jgi:Ca-activated chloride channel family protein